MSFADCCKRWECEVVWKESEKQGQGFRQQGYYGKTPQPVRPVSEPKDPKLICLRHKYCRVIYTCTTSEFCSQSESEEPDRPPRIASNGIKDTEHTTRELGVGPKCERKGQMHTLGRMQVSLSRRAKVRQTKQATLLPLNLNTLHPSPVSGFLLPPSNGP